MEEEIERSDYSKDFWFFVCLLDRTLRVTLFYIYLELNNINDTYISYIYILNTVMSLVLTLFFMKIIQLVKLNTTHKKFPF